MPKYARTYITQLLSLAAFLTICIISTINYDADTYIIAIPTVLVGLLVILVSANYIIMNDKNRLQFKFTIKKGKHFCSNSPRPIKSIIPMGKSVYHIMMEGGGLEYNFFEVTKQKAVNKIFGESYGLDHHKNSMRIGWNFDPLLNLYHIYLYGYEDGERVIKHLRDIPYNVFKDITFYLYIYKTKRNVYVEVRDIPEISTNYGDTLYPEDIEKKSWMLKPYFGGTMKAKGEIKTTISRIIKP